MKIHCNLTKKYIILFVYFVHTHTARNDTHEKKRNTQSYFQKRKKNPKSKRKKEIFITTRKSEEVRTITDIWHRCVLFVVIIIVLLVFFLNYKKRKEKKTIFSLNCTVHKRGRTGKSEALTNRCFF